MENGTDMVFTRTKLISTLGSGIQGKSKDKVQYSTKTATNMKATSKTKLNQELARSITRTATNISVIFATTCSKGKDSTFGKTEPFTKASSWKGKGLERE